MFSTLLLLSIYTLTNTHYIVILISLIISILKSFFCKMSQCFTYHIFILFLTIAYLVLSIYQIIVIYLLKLLNSFSVVHKINPYHFSLYINLYKPLFCILAIEAFQDHLCFMFITYLRLILQRILSHKGLYLMSFIKI